MSESIVVCDGIIEKLLGPMDVSQLKMGLNTGWVEQGL